MTRHFLTIIAALFFCIPAAFSQDNRNCDWKEKMKAEKIAFLTSEMSLTSEEAQVFWPVYNAKWEEKDKAQRTVMEAYKAMNGAIRSGKPEKEISEKLDAYLAALDKQSGMAQRDAADYRKVLPEEKVAKLFLAEEKFRREQIHKLHHRGDNPRKPQGGR